MATIQTTAGLGAGFKVKPHVQSFADEAERLFGVNHFLTYPGHKDTPDLALDTFATKDQGDRLCAWAIANWKRLGLKYIIWQQRIYNPSVAPQWRAMEDRGSATANHRDHVHATFYPRSQEDTDDMYDSAARDELVKRLDKIQGGLDEVFKKVVYLEETVARVVAEQDG